MSGMTKNLLNPARHRPFSSKIPPDPTWSIQSLQLDKQHPPVSDQELYKLARLALLDVSTMDEPRLKQDLGNMMHMIQQVQSFQSREQLTEFDLYDRPRGVTAAPVRDNSMSEKEETEGKRVWESFLKHKTTRVGAHSYFAIATKMETKGGDKSE